MNKIKISLFFITLFIWCAALAYVANPDYDLWARLIAGMSVIENGKVLMHDFYSYAPVNEFWFDHEWGASAIIYWVTTLSDFFGKTKYEMLIALQSVLIFLISVFSVLCVVIRKPKFSIPYQILYFAIAALAAKIAYVPTIRCHLFTFVFFALWLLVLESYRIYNKKQLLYVLPFIMLLWANIHGGCLSGLGILAIYAVGEFLNKKSYKPYIFTLLVSLLTLFINPYGIDYVKFLFTAGTMNRDLIMEWQSPFLMGFRAIKFLVFFVFMLVISIVQIFNKKDFKIFDKTKLLVLLVTGYVAVAYAKLIPLFVIASSVFLFDDVYEILNKNKILKFINTPDNKFVYAAILFIGAFALYIGQTTNKLVIDNRIYPYKAVQFIKENKILGNLFVEMTYGSYCAYKLYPQNKIFMDGRYEEVYNPIRLKEMKDFIRQEGENPDAVINNYPTDIVLLFNNFYLINPNVVPPAVEKLISLKWKVVYFDGLWFVLVRANYPCSKVINSSEILSYKSDFIFNEKEFYEKYLLDTYITSDYLIAN